jgi:hypothetical protein
MQRPADALPPPRPAHQELDKRECPARILGGDLLRQNRRHLPPPRCRRAKRHSGPVSDQVAAAARGYQDETGLTALHPELAREIATDGGHVAVYLVVQRLQLSRVRACLPAVKPVETCLSGGHSHPPGGHGNPVCQVGGRQAGDDPWRT